MIWEMIEKLLGMNGKKRLEVRDKTEEADAISSAMTRDIIRVNRKVSRLNQATNSKLIEIQADLDSITYKIAVATGAKKRGLK